MKPVPVTFKEWLPDQPELGNPGLIEATNVLPLNDGYVPFHPLDASAGTSASHTFNTIYGAFVATGTTKGSSYIFHHLGATLAFRNNVTFSSITATSPVTSDTSSFAQYENMVFFANGAHSVAKATMGAITAGGAAAFTAITAAPNADSVSVVGQFLVAGGIYDITAYTVDAYQRKLHYVQWSAIDDPVNWPTPGSATAIASQAGEQALYPEYGAVKAIHGGDQFAVILQDRAVTRMTYIGGTAVFQFDLIDNAHGLSRYSASQRVGDVTYFLSDSGFYATNGVSVEPIGDGVVDAAWSAITATATVSCAYDPENELVGWGNGNVIFFYNPKNRRWSKCTQAHKFLVTHGYNNLLMGWDGDMVRGYFAATAGAAVLTTGEYELNPGGFARVTGVKPLVSGTASSITVALGTRNDQSTAASFTAETAPHSRTGFADFRSEARYHRARVTINGEFTKAIGLEFSPVESGGT